MDLLLLRLFALGSSIWLVCSLDSLPFLSDTPSVSQANTPWIWAHESCQGPVWRSCTPCEIVPCPQPSQGGGWWNSAEGQEMGGLEKGGQRTAFPGRSLRCWDLLWKAGGCSHVQMWRGQPSALLHGEGKGSSLAILIELCCPLGVWEGVGRRWSMERAGKDG